MGADTGTFLYLVEGSWGSFQLIWWKKPILGTVKRTVKKSLKTENISLQEPSLLKNFEILNMIKYLAPTNRKKKSQEESDILRQQDKTKKRRMKRLK